MQVNRKTYKGMRVFVLMLSLVLVLSAVPVGFYLTAPRASSLTATASNWNDIANAVNQVKPGQTMEITISTGINGDWSSAKSADITIKQNTNVKIINNGTISLNKTDDWTRIDGNMFTVPSGAVLTLAGTGEYKVSYVAQKLSPQDGKHQFSYSRATIVRNNGGKVNIQSGTYNVTNGMHFNERNKNTKNQVGHVFCWTAVVWNQTSDSITNITGGTLTADGGGTAMALDSEYGHMNGDNAQGGMRLFLYSYGVYDGNVTMNGGTINVKNHAYFNSFNTDNSSKRAAVSGVIGYGIMSEKIHFINGLIDQVNNEYAASGNRTNVIGDDTPEGTISSWNGGLAYLNTPPVIDGGQIKTPTITTVSGNKPLAAFDNAKKFNKVSYAIVKTPSDQVSYNLSCFDTLYNIMNPLEHVTSGSAYPLDRVKIEHRWMECESVKNNLNTLYRQNGLKFSGVPASGTASDSNGRNNFIASGATSITNGNTATRNNAKLMNVYRYHHADGTIEAFFRWDKAPKGYASTILASEPRYNNFTGAAVGPNNAVSYAAGSGYVKESERYKWEFRSVDLAIAHYEAIGINPIDTWLTNSDRNLLPPRWTIFNCTYPGAEHNPSPVIAAGFESISPEKIMNNNGIVTTNAYMIFNYYENAPEQLRLEVTGTNSVYDGEQITPKDLGLKVYGTRNTPDRADDDLLYDATNPEINYLGVDLSYTVTTDNSLVSDVLPKNVGIHKIQVIIPANPATNRAAYDNVNEQYVYNINARNDVRFQDTSAPFTYPATLGSVAPNTLAAVSEGLPSALLDDFEFSWVEDADTILNVSDNGKHYHVKATLRDDEIIKHNYDLPESELGFLVTALVNSMQVNVDLGEISVVYGEELSLDSVTVPTEAEPYKEEILALVKDHLVLNDDDSYRAGTEAGRYTLKLDDSINQGGNFQITATEGTLIVTPRPLNIHVHLNSPMTYNGKSSEEWTPSANDVTNRFAPDVYDEDISVDPITVNYPNGGNANEAAEPLTVDKKDIRLSGTKATSYTVGEVTCDELKIDKATPKEGKFFNIPQTPELVYDPMVTLSRLMENKFNFSGSLLLGGSFSPQDGSIVPEVGPNSYTFIYRPSDEYAKNYTNVELQIPITVTPRPVAVSAESMNVEYGTAEDSLVYHWNFSNWTEHPDGFQAPILDNGQGGLTFGAGYTAESLGLVGDISGYSLTSDYTHENNAGANLSIQLADNKSFSLSARNYTFRFTAGQLTVIRRNLQVQVGDVDVSYSRMPGNLDISKLTVKDEEDLVNGNTLADILSNAILQFSFQKADGTVYDTGVQAKTEGYGVYLMVTPAPQNYELEILPGKLNILPLRIVLTPKNVTIDYGADIPDLEFTSNPPVEDMNQVYSGKILIDTDYVRNDPEKGKPGEYTIRPKSIDEQEQMEASSNYEIVFEGAAILTVRRVTLTVEEFDFTLDITYSPSLTLEQQLIEKGKQNFTLTDHSGNQVSGILSFVNGSRILDASDQDYTELMNFTPDNENYDPVENISAKVHVKRATISGRPQIGGNLMIGGYVYPNLVGLVPSEPGAYNFEWKIKGANDDESTATVLTDVGSGDRIELTDEATYRGKQLKLTVKINEEINRNYTGSLSTKWTTVITETKGVLTKDDIQITGGKLNVIYNGQPQTREVTSELEHYGQFTLYYNGQIKAPTDVGTYYLTVDHTGTTLLAPQTGLSVGVLVIEPKEVNYTFTVESKEYDGTTAATIQAGSIQTSDIEERDKETKLVSDHARARFTSANAGTVPVTISNVYLEGEGHTNYTLAAPAGITGEITKATVYVEPRLEVDSVDWKETGLDDAQTSGVEVYYTNFEGVKAKDHVNFNILTDRVALHAQDGEYPRGGELAVIDHESLTPKIEAKGNCDNNYVAVAKEHSPDQHLTLMVNKVAPAIAKKIPNYRNMTSRVYDSTKHLTDEELREFIQSLNIDGMGDLVKNISWQRDESGSTPIPTVSGTSTAVAYTAVYEDKTNSNYIPYTFRVRVPVERRPITITAAKFSDITYGDPDPLNGISPLYTASGVEEGKTIQDIFGTEPAVRTNYMQYDGVGTYQVTVNTINLRNNNYTVTAESTEFSVAPAVLTATATAAAKDYDGSEAVSVFFSQLNGKVREMDDVYLPDSVTGRLDSPNAGNGKAVHFEIPELEGYDAGNYTLTITNAEDLTVTVNKIQPTDYTFPTSATLTFGQHLSEAVLKGGSGKGTFLFENGSLIPGDVGTFNDYYMIFQPSDSINYNTVRQKVPVIVEVAILELHPVLSGSNYVGNTLTLNVPNVPGSAAVYMHVTWYRVDPDSGAATVVDSDTATYTLTSLDVGYVIRAHVYCDEDAPYQGEADAESGTILEEILTFWQKVWRWWQKLLAAITSLFRR